MLVRRPFRRLRRRFGWGLHLLAVAWVLVGIGCLRIPPRVAWLPIFAGLTLPLALGLNAFLLVVQTLRRRWLLAAVPAAVLLLAWPWWQRGLALRLPVAEPKAAAEQVRVLSYNVRIFNTYAALAGPDSALPRQEIAWVAQHPAHVLCLQEYYNQHASSNRRPVRLYNTTQRIGKGRQAFVSPSLRNRVQEFGMAIFSRYPIVRRGTIPFGKLTQNHAMWVDVRHPAGDTLRVYNAHFQSMALDEEEIVQTTRRRAWFEPPGLRLLRRFRNGAVRRSWQVDTLAAHASRCPHPVIICGDFNDVPYSYTYDRLARRFVNAHQSVGSGVGSTYNGRLPLLRIDNQFCSAEGLTPLWTRVRRDVAFSDHFPLEAVYQLR